MNTYTLNIGGRLLQLDRPVVMGIVNVTPDSFYPASRTQTDGDIAARISRIVAEGGGMIDIGACSMRPGSTPATPGEEAARLRHGLAIARQAAPGIPLSVDTFRPDVARMAVEEYGACVVNDISGGSEEMYSEVARLHVPYVLTYNNPAPRHEDIVVDCRYYLAERMARLHDLGVPDIIIDPGFGFNKTLEQNYALLSALDRLHTLDAPVLAGISRKSMICRVLGCSPREALGGTTVLHTLALQKGAGILRVHDVKAAVEAVALTQMTNQQSQETNSIRCFSRSL